MRGELDERAENGRKARYAWEIPFPFPRIVFPANSPTKGPLDCSSPAPEKQVSGVRYQPSGRPPNESPPRLIAESWSESISSSSSKRKEEGGRNLLRRGHLSWIGKWEVIGGLGAGPDA